MLGLGLTLKVLKEEKRIEHDLEDPVREGQKFFEKQEKSRPNESIESNGKKAGGNFPKA